ncbi:hypothetical protein ABFW07_10510 [Acinetobacter soli]|uniref:hypothetical protein n=1 Tax=Acinetobacter soli TaxID=487316 RepID=UPI003218A8E7
MNNSQPSLFEEDLNTETDDHSITPSDIHKIVDEIIQINDDIIVCIDEQNLPEESELAELFLDIDDLLYKILGYFTLGTHEDFFINFDLTLIYRKIKVIKYKFTLLQYERTSQIDKKELKEIVFLINEILDFLSYKSLVDDIKKEKNEANKKYKEFYEKLKNADVLVENLRNIKINEVYDLDVRNFNNLAKKYEIAFYGVMLFSALYFLGMTFYVNDINLFFFSIQFPEKIHGALNNEFYIQKISLLILNTTLAAFFLKRSFMNRRLADEAYRTAKEFDALPLYLNSMPDGMREKIRFDLAYKYFGSSIHHDSYTSGENLMHENIKANTEFVKVLKGVPSTTDESKADKDKNE